MVGSMHRAMLAKQPVCVVSHVVFTMVKEVEETTACDLIVLSQLVVSVCEMMFLAVHTMAVLVKRPKYIGPLYLCLFSST